MPASRGWFMSRAKPRLASIVTGMTMRANLNVDEQRLPDERVARHPDVVVDPDEARVAGVKQVEVREST